MQRVTPVHQPPPLEELLTPWLQKHANLSSGECQHIVKLWQEKQHETGLPQLLLKLGTVSAADLSMGLAELLQLPQLEPRHYPREALCGDALSAGFLQRHRVLPIAESEQQITLAMTDPSNELAVQSVALACQKTVRRIVADDSTLQQLYDDLYGSSNSAMDQLLGDLDGNTDNQDVNVDQLRDMASEAPVIRLVNLLIHSAVERNASDIHIEPFEHSLTVRLRCDGILQTIDAPPAQMNTAVISRIKIMAGLDIAERRLPQDGRINLRVQGSQLDIRVSTVPCVHGESVVMRLLRRDNLILAFEQLGLSPAQHTQLNQLLAQPNGLLIVSGPTGSGKTTSLYTALRQLNTPERKIITVEDPVEYKLDGINQIQVNNTIGLSFASALRTIVRQDPDIIMVGEIRDQQAAEICVQSALTGHLVLSTLHTNQAAGCITRLLEMGVADYLLTSTLLAAVGQRLVRKLCHHCAQPFSPSAELRQTLRLACPDTADDTLRLYQPGGCDHCSQSGYQGRVALMEILPVSDAIQQLILQQADAHQLQQAAVAEGMLTLYVDGCQKVIAGLTTFEEVLRVTREE